MQIALAHFAILRDDGFTTPNRLQTNSWYGYANLSGYSGAAD